VSGFEVKGNLGAILHDGHVRRALARHGLLALVDEALREIAVIVSQGSFVLLLQHSTGWGSWSITIDDGPTYHIRTRQYAIGERFPGGLYLRDQYKGGLVVAHWRTPHDVRVWFRQRAEECAA
jgi:hypothetical protein